MLYSDWNILPPPPETHPPHQDRVYPHPHYSQYLPSSHQEQHHHHHHHQHNQHHNHTNNSTSLPSLPTYNSYVQQQHQQRQRQPSSLHYPHFLQEQHQEHHPYHTRDHTHGPNYPPASYPHDAVPAPVPLIQSLCSSNPAQAYGQNEPHSTMEERPRQSLPPSFSNDTSHHLYQQQQQPISHYRYPTTLSSAPPSAAVNVSLPSWSGSGYGGPSVRPSSEATFASHQAEEPHEYLSESSRYPYAQLPQAYPHYHDHSREIPSTHTHEQDHSHRNTPLDNQYTAHARQEPLHHRDYHHTYGPSPILRPRPQSPSGTVPSVPPYESQKWQETPDYYPRKNDIMGDRNFVKSSTFTHLPPLANLTNPKHTPSMPLERQSDGDYRRSRPHEVANQYRSPLSCEPDVHRSSQPKDKTHPRYPSPTVTPPSSADSLTELANASLLIKHMSKSTTEELAYPSPSSSTFEQPFGSVLHGFRRDQYTPPNHACYTCGGSDVEAVGDRWTNGVNTRTNPCNECGKSYKRHTNIVTQKWEHTPMWKETSRIPLSQSERIQILDAASILFTLKTTTPSSFPASDINSRASTPSTITQPNSPQMSSDTLHRPNEDISAFSIHSLLDTSTDAGPPVADSTKADTKTKGKAKGRKAKRRKVSA